MYQRCLFYKFMISYIDTRVSMNKHVCNFVLCCEGKRKKKNERTCYIWKVYILRKGGKLRFHGIPRKIKKKKEGKIRDTLGEEKLPV